MIKSTKQVSCFYSSKAFTYKLNWNSIDLLETNDLSLEICPNQRLGFLFMK